jgi:HK97 family phage major capsid protein
MSDMLKRLLEERENVLHEARNLNDAAEKEGREFTADAQSSWDQHMARISELDKRINEVSDLEDRNAKADEVRAKMREHATTATSADERPDVAEELRSFLRGERGRSFDIGMGLESRDVTTTSAAGTIAQGFRGQLWEYAVETSGILSAGVDLLETTSGEEIKLPRVTAYSTVTTTAEAAALTESDPTFSSVSSTVSKGGYLVQVPTELMQDSAFNIQSYLAKWAGRELGNAVGSAAVTAALAAASAGATTAAGTAGGFGAQNTADRGFDYLITLFHSVLAPYRNSSSCAWVMSDPTAAAVRKIKTADGVYAWQNSVIAGQPDTILGKPVHIDTYVPDAAVSVESILFGDFSSLVVRIAGGIRFERSDEYAFNADMSTFRAVVRHGSVSVDANALKSLTHAGT